MNIAATWKRWRDGLFGRKDDPKDLELKADLALLRTVECTHKQKKDELRALMRENAHCFENHITDTLNLLGGHDPHENLPPENNGQKS